MTDKRRTTKAIKELEETKILVDFLLYHQLDFEAVENFTDQQVRRAKEWYAQQRGED